MKNSNATRPHEVLTTKEEFRKLETGTVFDLQNAQTCMVRFPLARL